jgi:hypothetical protein
VIDDVPKVSRSILGIPDTLSLIAKNGPQRSGVDCVLRNLTHVRLLALPGIAEKAAFRQLLLG